MKLVGIGRKQSTAASHSGTGGSRRERGAAVVCFLPISTGLAQNPLQLFHILQSQIPGILLFKSQAAQGSRTSPLPEVFWPMLSQCLDQMKWCLTVKAADLPIRHPPTSSSLLSLSRTLARSLVRPSTASTLLRSFSFRSAFEG